MLEHLMNMNINELVVIIIGLIVVIGIITSIFKGLFGIAKVAVVIFVLYVVINFFMNFKK